MSGYIEDDLTGRIYSASEGQRTVKGRGVGLSPAPNHFNKVPSHSKGGNQRYHGSKSWWSVGEFYHQGLTHQSVGLSLGHNEEETWDLSDSLADLYQAVTQRQLKEAPGQKGHTRRGSGGGERVDGDRSVDMKKWLREDTRHGFIRVYTSEDETNARVFPCTISTPAQKICLQLAIPGNSLHVQMNGDVIRRMEPFDCPLAIQNEYLAGLGYSDIKYIQEEGLKESLAYLIRFYAGKPLSDSTYGRNQLQTYAYIRKGKLLHQWGRRLCVLSGTRLLIYRDKESEPTAVQLARGSVEEVQIKGQAFVLKITSTYQGERSIYISFVTLDDFNKWLRKIRKATVKLPSKADLSNCHLEFIPETVFVNIELQILILRHNALRERPFDEDIYTIGWLDDLPRFTFLRSLNLADNQLMTFPLSLCNVRSLMELNLASNKLEEIPPQICELVNLQVLHLHNNLLNSLPEEISKMRQLTVIVLAFNRFVTIPPVLLQSQHMTFKLDSIIMAGNEISRLPAEQLMHMAHIKKIDLRLNKLQLLPTETARFQSLEHVTHVDIRENHIMDLDIRAIRCLEYLNCERNNIKTLQVNGSSLKNIFASYNSLQTLTISPKPEWLVSLNISHNKLTELPNWLPDCFFLVNLDVSHNMLTVLPDRLFTDTRRLKIMKANNNHLASLPDKIRTDALEELHLQHNLIRHLSVELFIKAHRLRYLNMTRNKLCDLPPPNKNDSYNKLQELYLSFNHLNNRCLHKICCFPRLRVLHLAKNKISVIEETDIEKLEQLMELNISSNNLTYLPAVLGRHSKLQVLRANCNLLQELPNFKNSSGLKVLEVSSNHLVNVNMSNLMASQMSLLDISANPNILVKSHDIDAARNSKRLCMLDMRGQNLSLEDVRSQSDSEEVQFWKTGLSQTSGIRNKLSVTAINKPHFNDKGNGLFAIFDGGRNEAVANSLCDIVPSVLREERARSKNPYVYMKYSFLSAHRNLKTQGQKLGASAAIVHLHKDENGQHLLSVGNVGDVQVVLCRQKRAYLLSRPFFMTENIEDKKRVIQSGGIITEDGRISGVTYNTRLLGCSFLYPHIIPDPYVTSTSLTPEDTLFIIASNGLWQYVTYEEAVTEIMDIPDPVVAAKRLQDLAQGYGSRENISVLVARLMLTEEERSRIKDLMKVQRSTQKELIKILSNQEDLLQMRDGVPRVEELDGVVINKSGHARKQYSSQKQVLDAKSIGSILSDESTSDVSPELEENFSFLDELSKERMKSHKKLRKENSDGVTALHAENRMYKKKAYSSFHSSPENFVTRRLVDGANEMQHNDNALDYKYSKTGAVKGDSEQVVDTRLQKEKMDAHFADHYEDDQEKISEDDEDMFVSSEECIGEDTHLMGSSTGFGIPLDEDDGANMKRQDNFYHRRSPSDFSVSPTESVSSIDVRVHHENDETNRYNPLSSETLNTVKDVKTVFPGTDLLYPSQLSETSQLNKNEFYTRPLSPDSVVSQDEFVKPPINFANIDRDALLFHQMQMARAQAQTGSNASLDSIQSAPMQASSKDAYRGKHSSSHSIEVLLNFGKNSNKRSLSQSLKHGGKSSSGSTFGGTSTVTSSQVANVDSESEAQSFALKSFQRRVEVDVHPHFTSNRKIGDKSSRENTNDDYDVNDSDNDTLVGDAEDLARIKDVDFPDQASSSNDKRKFHDIHTFSPSNRTSGQSAGEDEAGESDSDESLGDISLGDGYAAMQFSRMDRLGSLSMNNVLESESEDYPELYMPDKNRSQLKHPYNSSHFLQTFQPQTRLTRNMSSVRKKDVDSTYEIIDTEEMQAADVTTVNEFTDDVNPYEEVQYLPQEDSSKTSTAAALLGPAGVSSEEDIDALYAKVNRIKMDRLKKQYGRDKEVMESHFHDFLPSFLSGVDNNRYDNVRKNISPMSAGEIKNYASVGKDKNEDRNNEDKEIFFSASNLFNYSNKPDSGVATVASQNIYRRDYRTQDIKQPIKSPKVFRKPPPPPPIDSASDLHSSAPSSTYVLPQTLSPPSFPKCNIPETTSLNKASLSNTSTDHSRMKSFKPSSTDEATTRFGAEMRPPLHQTPMQQLPLLPPKIPFAKTQDFVSVGNSTKPIIPPRTMASHMITLTPPYPLKDNTSPKLTTFKQVQSGNNSPECDKTVLSAHELYPESHQPGLFYYPTSDMTDVTNKLSSQKSMTITYL
ncbi:hypothetical protein BsWGS_16253 [Bradybaena similaris]